jgi:dTDP-glucose pyrophosphorylase/predicted transcriptional regulator
MNTQNMQSLDSVILPPSASIAEAIARLDQAGTGALVLCTQGKKLYGLLTDGDVRRAMLKSKALEGPCGTIANRTPIVTFVPLLPSEALRLMNQHDISHLPVVNARGELEDFVLRKDLVAEVEQVSGGGQRIDDVVISPSDTIIEAIAQLDKAGTGALVLCSTGRKIYGLLTDGDIRRAILNAVPMETACEKIASLNPFTSQSSIPTAEALRLMNQHDINHLPLVDQEGNIAEFLLRKDFVREDQIDLSAVIMAGGYGKRLLPMTEKVPKPMLPVGDRPLLELTIEQLRRSGIRDLYLTTHYLPESIINHFGDGNDYGVRLKYVREEKPLGTAGGLKLLQMTERTLLVINGDILTGVPFYEMLSYHRKHQADITVGVRKYEVQVPFGVVECDDVQIKNIQEKPSLKFFINAGIYIIEPGVCSYIPAGERFDMTDLIQRLIEAERKVVSFPIMEYWLDVGRHEDYMQAQEDVRNGRI